MPSWLTPTRCITGIGIDGIVGDNLIGRALVEHFKTTVVGHNPFDVEGVWEAIWKPKLIGRRGLSTRAISAIDIALWIP